MDEKYLEAASEHTDQMNTSGINQVSKLAFPTIDLRPDEYKALECEDCGDDLLEFRKKKGFLKCTLCQEALEGARKRLGKF